MIADENLEYRFANQDGTLNAESLQIETMLTCIQQS